MPDERAIRDLVDTWMKANHAGDTATVLSLMSDDVIFMVPAGRRARARLGLHAGDFA